MIKKFALFCFVALAGAVVNSPNLWGVSDIVGSWDCALESPGGRLRFGLHFDDAGAGAAQGRFVAYIVNGQERIKIPNVRMVQDAVTVAIDHYDSAIDFRVGGDSLSGIWKKRRGPDEWITMPFAGRRPDVNRQGTDTADVNRITGRWLVRFEGSDDPAVGIFESRPDKTIRGTFLTTTGDYRFLHGGLEGTTLELSCFDGAHAFLFRAVLDEQWALTGEFWSSNEWHQRWTAVRASEAELPDAFQQTKWVGSRAWSASSFPDLNGRPTRLDDERFAAPVRLIYIFGSWCPNCHDAAEYFQELVQKYGQEKLSILGLAFELTGDFQRDAEQVRRYLNRHGVDYPVLIAGIADKQVASRAIPFLDQVRSYPTTIFLDSRQNVRAIHTGFTGPATENDYRNMKDKFESLIDTILLESATKND